ncbi:MAG: sigma 54-interacting transcriptional regulator, partial [Polyangiaceae bacterium]
HLESFLRRALALLVKVASARLGYIELRRSPDSNEPDWWIGHGTDQNEASSFRETISQGVIAEAVTGRRTVVSASAREDPRFKMRGSVQANHIDAILCAPIGDPPVGVVYLQGRNPPGPFATADEASVQRVATHLTPFLERLLLRDQSNPIDPTAPYRARLAGTDEMIGRSDAIAEVLKQVTLVASHDMGVLLTGPTGTGKTLLARIIHQNSRRANGPFVEVNSAALPEALIENELFGAAPGAHSGARNAIPGKIHAAERGTLFLDEVADLSLAAQAKLLQFLQSGTYFPLGSNKPVTANVRVIAATHRSLEDAIAQKEFREDLYYRLHVLPIRVPGLAERAGDIAPLAEQLTARICRANGLPGLRLSTDAIHALEVADWPGNVRQLENCLVGASLRASGTGALQIEPSHIFPEPKDTRSSTSALSYEEHLARFRRQLISRVLDDTDWNVTEAARRLDLRRSYVHKLIRAHQLKRKDRPERL